MWVPFIQQKVKPILIRLIDKKRKTHTEKKEVISIPTGEVSGTIFMADDSIDNEVNQVINEELKEDNEAAQEIKRGNRF